MDKALAKEIERTRQELQPDMEGFRRGLRQFRRRSWLLSRKLLSAMRSALAEEARLVAAEGWTEQVITAFFDFIQVSDASGGASARHDEALARELGRSMLTPREEEVDTFAIELAQLLLSNWAGFLMDLSPADVGDAMAGLHEDPPRFPAEVTTGCGAYPVSDELCRSALAAYLMEEQLHPLGDL